MNYFRSEPENLSLPPVWPRPSSTTHQTLLLPLVTVTLSQTKWRCHWFKQPRHWHCELLIITSLVFLPRYLDWITHVSGESSLVYGYNYSRGAMVSWHNLHQHLHPSKSWSRSRDFHQPTLQPHQTDWLSLMGSHTPPGDNAWIHFWLQWRDRSRFWLSLWLT